MKSPRNEREAHAEMLRTPAMHTYALGEGERERKSDAWPILAIWSGAVAIICVATFFTG